MTGLIIATGLAAVILGCGMAVLVSVLRPCYAPPLADGQRRVLAAKVADITERHECTCRQPDHSDVLAIVCAPCNGQPGRCTCAGLCGHPECVGDHTMTWQMAAELQQLLYGTGEVDELGRPE